MPKIDEAEEIKARIAALEIMVSHIIAETAIKDPDGSVAALVEQVRADKPEPFEVRDADQKDIKAHLDRLLMFGAVMRKGLLAKR